VITGAQTSLQWEVKPTMPTWPHRRERAISPHSLYHTVTEIVTVSSGAKGKFPLLAGTGRFSLF
jgi:hypothetical protein